MTHQTQIMVVDDTETNRLILKTFLEDSFDIVEAGSGEECLEKIALQQPDLVLLDINMPGLNGYEVCTQLRKQKETDTLPVIFVSAKDSAEERLHGFEVGANDYVIKPVDRDELVKKIATRLEHRQETKRAKDDAKMAMNVAMEAMTASSELGQIIQFVKDSSALNTLDAVVDAICVMIQAFELKVCAMVVGNGATFYGCDTDSVEAKVLERFQASTDKIVHVGVRTIIRSNHLVLLIKNMPLDDENRYGRLKDHLAVLADIADGRISTLQAELAVNDQRRKFLKSIISVTEVQLKETSKKLVAHETAIYNVMNKMVDELDAMLFGLGLDDDQETKLRSLAERATQDLEATSKETSGVDMALDVILQSLYELMRQEEE